MELFPAPLLWPFAAVEFWLGASEARSLGLLAGLEAINRPCEGKKLLYRTDWNFCRRGQSGLVGRFGSALNRRMAGRGGDSFQQKCGKGSAKSAAMQAL